MANRQDEVQETLRYLDKRDRKVDWKGQPCLACAASAACADLELACQEYFLWTRGEFREMRKMQEAKSPREPTKAKFLKVMQDKDEDDESN